MKAAPAQPVPVPPPPPPSTLPLYDSIVRLVVRVVAAFGILGLGLWVALSPNVYYQPQPKAVLFFLVAFLPALLFGEALLSSAKLNVSLPGVAITTGGLLAAILAALLILDWISKPEKLIAVYQVYEADKTKPVYLGWGTEAVKIDATADGLKPLYFRDDNALIVIFPTQALTVTAHIKKSRSAPATTRTLHFTADRESNIYLDP